MQTDEEVLVCGSCMDMEPDKKSVVHCRLLTLLLLPVSYCFAEDGEYDESFICSTRLYTLTDIARVELVMLTYLSVYHAQASCSICQ